MRRLCTSVDGDTPPSHRRLTMMYSSQSCKRRGGGRKKCGSTDRRGLSHDICTRFSLMHEKHVLHRFSSHWGAYDWISDDQV